MARSPCSKLFPEDVVGGELLSQEKRLNSRGSLPVLLRKSTMGLLVSYEKTLRNWVSDLNEETRQSG